MAESEMSDMGKISATMFVGQCISRAPATAKATVGALWTPDAQESLGRSTLSHQRIHMFYTKSQTADN